MKKKFTVLALCAMLFALSYAVDAQQKKIPRIGYLTANFPSAQAARNEAFRQGLRELGYIEGKNIVIEWRPAEGKFDRLPALAAELPVEQPTKFEFVINLKAAKQIGLTIPPNVLVRADKVIK